MVLVVGRVLQLGGFWRDYIRDWGPWKSGSAPVRGDLAYEPAVLSRANAETSHSVRVGAGSGRRDVVGRGEKISHEMVRSRKPPLTFPLHSRWPLLCPIQARLCNPHGYELDSTSPDPQPSIKSIDDPSRSAGEQIHHFLTPKAITRVACGHSPSAPYFA